MADKALEHEVRARTAGTMVGRNGSFSLTEVSLFPTGDEVKIDGIGKRGNAIHGGLWISKEAMDEVAAAWLKMRGKA